MRERIISQNAISFGLRTCVHSLVLISGWKRKSLDDVVAPFTKFLFQVPIVQNAGTSTSSEADPLFLFQMPLLRSEVHPLLQLVHHLTQLHTRHARLHAQLLHARLHAMLLHDERLHSELQPVHRLHVRRSSQLLDAIQFATATPSATTDRLTSSTRRLSDATNPVFHGPGILLFDVPFYGISRLCSFICV